MASLKAFLKMFTQETKVYVRQESEQTTYKFKLDNSLRVQNLLELICHKMFGNKIGMTEIELFYDDESSKSETELDVSEKMGALKFHNLICKIKTDKKVDAVDSVPTPADETNGDGFKTRIDIKCTGSGNDVSIEETITQYGSNQQRTVILIGRTGNGKSLLGCVLLDKYGDGAFEVSGDVKSCTKFAEYRQSFENQITVHDTKGFFDTESECMKDYSTGTIEKKIQIIDEIMQALKHIQATGVHAICLVVKYGNRFDIKDKDIIDHLGTYVFNDDLKKKVYLVCTNSPAKHCTDKQKGIDWLNKQCQHDGKSSEGGVTSKVFSQYYEVIENDMNRVFFVQNKNPDETDDQDEINKCKKDNKTMAQKIIKTLRERGEGTVNLQSKYKILTEEYEKLTTPEEKKEHFEKYVNPAMNPLGKKSCGCSIL